MSLINYNLTFRSRSSRLEELYIKLYLIPTISHNSYLVDITSLFQRPISTSLSKQESKIRISGLERNDGGCMKISHVHPFQTRECSRIFKFVVHGDTSSSCNNNVEVVTIED